MVDGGGDWDWSHSSVEGGGSSLSLSLSLFPFRKFLNWLNITRYNSCLFGMKFISCLLLFIFVKNDCLVIILHEFINKYVYTFFFCQYMLETAVGGAAGGTIPVFMKLDQQFLLYSNKGHI